jgi:cytochrome c
MAPTFLPETAASPYRREVFEQQCAACHGEKGEGGVGERLVGGQGTIATARPIKTVGSYWPYVPTLFGLYPPRDAAERAAVAEQ